MVTDPSGLVTEFLSVTRFDDGVGTGVGSSARAGAVSVKTASASKANKTMDLNMSELCFFVTKSPFSAALFSVFSMGLFSEIQAELPYFVRLPEMMYLKAVHFYFK